MLQVFAGVLAVGILLWLVWGRRREDQDFQHLNQLKDAVRELTSTRDLLRQLTVRQAKAHEEESHALAQKIHEGLGQQLAVLRGTVAIVHGALSEGRTPQSQMLGSGLEEVDQAIQTVRSLSAKLYPKVLDLGVVAALEWAVAEFMSRTGTPCELRVEETSYPMREEQVRVVFLTAGQALERVTRRTDVTEVCISLEASESDYVLEIADDGRAGDFFILPDEFEDYFSLQERIRALGGESWASSLPARGNVQGARLPL